MNGWHVIQCWREGQAGRRQTLTGLPLPESTLAGKSAEKPSHLAEGIPMLADWQEVRGVMLVTVCGIWTRVWSHWLPLLSHSSRSWLEKRIIEAFEVVCGSCCLKAPCKEASYLIALKMRMEQYAPSFWSFKRPLYFPLHWS